MKSVSSNNVTAILVVVSVLKEKLPEAFMQLSELKIILET